MELHTDRAFWSTLQSHLQARARRQSLPPSRLWQQLVFERLLARLLVIANGRWVGAGDYRLEARLEESQLAIDETGQITTEAEETVTAWFAEAQDLLSDDALEFEIGAHRRSTVATRPSALLFGANASLGGRVLESIEVQVGFDYPVETDIEWVTGSDLLAFTQIPPVEIPTKSRVLQLAQKLARYALRDTWGGSCLDLVGIVRLAGQLSCQAGQLRAALKRALSDAEVERLPLALPAPPPGWASTYRHQAAEFGLPTELTSAHARASALCDPLLSGAVTDAAVWDPGSSAWTKPA